MLQVSSLYVMHRYYVGTGGGGGAHAPKYLDLPGQTPGSHEILIGISFGLVPPP